MYTVILKINITHYGPLHSWNKQALCSYPKMYEKSSLSVGNHTWHQNTAGKTTLRVQGEGSTQT